MCCFPGPVRAVFGTRIFARASGRDRQFLVYEMTYAAASDLAMILPLPGPAGAAEGAVRFVDLSGYREFFDDLERAFPRPRKAGLHPRRASVPEASALAVQSVGTYDASFVPGVADFARLDPRFRLPDRLWRAMPQYGDYGFAVFKLRAGASAAHPMAFEFPRRDPRALFFPTVHVHDGEVHPTAAFDHALYAQRGTPPGAPEPEGWSGSQQPAREVADVRRAAGVLSPDLPLSRALLAGELPNRDTLLAVG